MGKYLGAGGVFSDHLKVMPEVDLQINQLCLRQPKAIHLEGPSDKAPRDVKMLLAMMKTASECSKLLKITS